MYTLLFFLALLQTLYLASPRFDTQSNSVFIKLCLCMASNTALFPPEKHKSDIKNKTCFLNSEIRLSGLSYMFKMKSLTRILLNA